MGFATKIYSGGAKAGVLYAQIGAIIGTVIGIGLISYGIYSLKTANDDSKSNNDINKAKQNTGYGLIVLGLLMIIGGWVYYWITTKNKFLAFAGGARGFADIIAGPKF